MIPETRVIAICLWQLCMKYVATASVVFSYFDVKFEILVHAVDVIENVLNDAGNNTHPICIVQHTLKNSECPPYS